MTHHGWRELPDAQRKGRTWQVHRPPRDHHDPGHPRLPRQDEPIQWRLSIWRETQISRKLNYWNISFHLIIPKLKVAKAPERLWVFADLRPGAVWCRLSVSIVGVDRVEVSRQLQGLATWSALPWWDVMAMAAWRGFASFIFTCRSSMIFNLTGTQPMKINEKQWHHKHTIWIHLGHFRTGGNMDETPGPQSRWLHILPAIHLCFLVVPTWTPCVWTNVCIRMPTPPFSAPACSPQRRKAAANWLRNPMVSTWSCSHGGPRWAWCLRTTIITRITRIPCPTCNSYVLPERQELHWKSTASCAQSIRAMR